jgi:high affinity Mn2+ porin
MTTIGWTVRFAEAWMPKVANGINLDADMARARAENIEFEFHRKIVSRQTGVLRLLTFVNHANLGDYQQAIDNFLAGLTPKPEITDPPLQTTIKCGFGVNFEQPLNDWMGIFGRWGWNEGQHEFYAYTEVDQMDQIGAAFKGTRWHRKWDRAGVVFVSNGISHDHAEYLALGGDGFLLGDGRLNYGRENIVETYYTLHAWRGIYPSFGCRISTTPVTTATAGLCRCRPYGCMSSSNRQQN